MLSRVVRFSNYTAEMAVPLMFIDSLLPRHHRLNFYGFGTFAGFDAIHPTICWIKLNSMMEGALLDSEKLW